MKCIKKISNKVERAARIAILAAVCAAPVSLFAAENDFDLGAIGSVQEKAICQALLVTYDAMEAKVRDEHGGLLSSEDQVTGIIRGSVRLTGRHEDMKEVFKLMKQLNCEAGRRLGIYYDAGGGIQATGFFIDLPSISGEERTKRELIHGRTLLDVYGLAEDDGASVTGAE